MSSSSKGGAKGAKHYGLTPPISLKGPEQFEILATEKLKDTLRDYDQYETKEEAQQRQEVLGKLDRIFKDFVKNVSVRDGWPEELANVAGGKIFTFGSYRLGVHGRGSDIDTLCVAPKHVKREDFLEGMYESLKARPEVTEITAVAEAYVPIIKMEFSGISIDLIFARLSESSVKDDLDLSNDNLLRNIDERCVRSLNGSRVTDDILRLVPNVENFRTALRCIKVWAQRRAIYSNVMGFFGGVAWAIVVARVCQLLPNAAPATLVSKFFKIMHEWAWPQPVLLKLIEDIPGSIRVWNPKIYNQDKTHRMPIITPAYPSMCSTHNTTRSTQVITTQEFGRGAEITRKILLGTETWNTLFEKSDFFLRYKYYIQVCASSYTPDGQLKFSGMVESKLRQLMMKLETVQNLQIAHPFVKSFSRTQVCKTEEDKKLAMRGKILESTVDGATSSVESVKDTTTTSAETTKVDDGATDPESSTVYTTMLYIGIVPSPKDPANPSASRQLLITAPIQEFQEIVRNWDQYDEAQHSIQTYYLKRSQLPMEVYDDEEYRAKAQKKRDRPSKGADSTATTSTLVPDDDNGSTQSETKRRKLTGADGSVIAPSNVEDDMGDPGVQTDAVSEGEEAIALAEEDQQLEVLAPPPAPIPLPEGAVSYQVLVKNQQAARSLGNFSGLNGLGEKKKGLEIKLKTFAK